MTEYSDIPVADRTVIEEKFARYLERHSGFAVGRLKVSLFDPDTRTQGLSGKAGVNIKASPELSLDEEILMHRVVALWNALQGGRPVLKQGEDGKVEPL